MKDLRDFWGRVVYKILKFISLMCFLLFWLFHQIRLPDINIDPQWIAILAALFLGTNILQDWFKRRHKAVLRSVEIIKSTQYHNGSDHTYQRLVVKNVGDVAALDVRVLLTYTLAPSNFIPIPLRWTHFNTFNRNISIGEPAYLDVIAKEESETHYRFCWPGSPPQETLLNTYNSEHGDIRLEFFERDRKVGDIKLKFSDDFLKII